MLLDHNTEYIYTSVTQGSYLGLGCYAGQPMVLDQRWAATDSGPGQPTETLSPPENSCWSPCTRKLISAYYSFIDPEKMKGWVDIVGWPAADGLPTWVVTRQLQVGRRTGKDRRPQTDVLPLSQRHQRWCFCDGLPSQIKQKNIRIKIKYMQCRKKLS